MDDKTADIEAANGLLMACADGDRDAFQRLYLKEAPAMLSFALRFTGSNAAAEDALQDTFVQVWQNACRFRRERGSARAWLFGLLRYRLINQYRQSASVVTGALPDEGWADPGPSPEQCYIAESQRRIMVECLRHLQIERRRPILMAFYLGLTYEQIAETLSVPLGTIKSRIRSGLKGLQECLKL